MWFSTACATGGAPLAPCLFGWQCRSPGADSGAGLHIPLPPPPLLLPFLLRLLLSWLPQMLPARPSTAALPPAAGGWRSMADVPAQQAVRPAPAARL